MIQIPLEIGDTILAGRFKNKKITVKEISYDEYGNPTVNGRSILKIRIPKLYQKQENNMKLNENIQELDGTKEGAQEAISIIDNGLQGQVPYVEVTSGLIGRWDYLHIRVIFEKKEDWKNNIKQNAAQFVMTLTSDGTLQESHRHLYIPSKRPHYALDSLPIKFRKTKVKSLQDVISKISKYIQEVKKSFASEGHPLKENNRKLREAAKPFSKQTNVKIKQENKRWHIYLETVDGDECLTPIGYETKEQAEHAAMMKGYNFKGNPYSEDYKGLEVDKPTKREVTKGTDKPEEMKLGKEKEIKLESMIRRAIREVKKKVKLKEVFIDDPILESKIDEMAQLHDEIDQIKARLEQLTKRYDPLNKELTQIMEQYDALGEKAIETKNILITIKKRGNPSVEVAAYKERFLQLYNKVNSQMKKQADAWWEKEKKFKSIPSLLAVQKKTKTEGFLKEENWLSKIKNWFLKSYNSLFNANMEVDKDLLQMKTIVNKLH